MSYDIKGIKWYDLEAKRGNYGSTRKSLNRFKAIVIHYTGNKKDSARNNALYFRNNSTTAGAHRFVDATGIYMSTPLEYDSWSVGRLYNRKYAKYWGVLNNSNTINIEIACDAGNSRPTQKAIDNTIALTRYYMKKYNISLVVRHKDVCGKECPAFWWDDTKWKKEFLDKLKDTPSKKPQNKPQASKNDNSSYYTNTGIYVVRKDCYIHKTAYMSSPNVQIVKAGDAYTIVEVNKKGDGSYAGKLKSGIGWITLNKEFVRLK